MLTLLLACTQGVFDSGPAQVQGPVEPRNVLLVVVDTLRADHLQAWGYGRQTSPVLSDWAADAVRFEHAIAPDAWTVPSVSSLWTGLYPAAHGVLAHNTDARIDDDELVPELTTLPELFQAAGFQTGGLVKSPVIRADRGHGQGFDSLETVPGKVDYDTSGSELTDAAVDWLSAHDQDPFFLYLHYMEPHTHYIAPAPFYDLFAEGTDSELVGTHAEVKGFLDGTSQASAADIARVNALYDGELAYLDTQLERLFSHLASTGRDRDTAVVVVGDHGEQFGEHGGWIHGDLWQENLRVPLILKVPGLAGRDVPGWVQSLDLTATLAGVFGLEPVPEWHSRDLAEALLGGTVPDEPVFFEYANERGVITPDGWKYFWDGGAPHLFDLDSDPWEQADLIDAEPQLAAELDALTEALYAQAQQVRTDREPAAR